MRTTLDSGAWVEHTPIQDLRYGHKRVLERAGGIDLPPDALDDDGQVNVAAIMASLDFKGISATRQAALWALIVTAWSYDFPVPEIDKASGTVTGAEVLDELSLTGIPLDDGVEIETMLAPFAVKLGRKPSPKGATTSTSSGSSRAAANGSRRG